MTSRWITSLIAVILLLGHSCAGIAKQTCSVDEAYAAEEVTDYIESWNGLYQAYKIFAACDDGGVAEGFSDDVGRLFINRWADLPHLGDLVRGDPGFEKFILEHLDETLPADELRTINSLTKSNCPKGMSAFCAQVGRAALRSSE